MRPRSFAQGGTGPLGLRRFLEKFVAAGRRTEEPTRKEGN